MKAGILVIFLSLFLGNLKAFAQEEGNDDPVYVVDSVVANKDALEKMAPDQIGIITISRGSKAVIKYGPQAENGVVYIETKVFARNRVNNLLRKTSAEYDKAFQKYGNDSSFYFIVNTKPVTPTNESALMTVDNKTLRSIQVIYAKELEDKYRVTGHPVGVIITSSEE
ncbi:hypothetical protein DVR12_01425 [Chitinophaga silvatica]|uniref:TonB-dependent receptor n=1 Tax=Chitinophaga silvatica TaxID=2282649 RepID=A0A3E1YGI0_9BACT|nr:hypothetical protein [Chitinophaga silvatica]RFS26476.1 hypothetical protein DVR12_01425 [Chitinophaga silvatica]